MVCCVYSLELPHRAIPISTLTHHYFIEDQNEIPKLCPFASCPGAMFNPQWLKLPMSRINFHGSKGCSTVCCEYSLHALQRGIQQASVALSDVHLTGYQEVTGSILCWVWQHSFMEIDHGREIFLTLILCILLIQEGQLSVSGERMCTSTG